MKKLLNLFAKKIEVRNARRELESMTDRELSDIGIKRGDIPFIIR